MSQALLYDNYEMSLQDTNGTVKFAMVTLVRHTMRKNECNWSLVHRHTCLVLYLSDPSHPL
jgi:hypothetical protein